MRLWTAMSGARRVRPEPAVCAGLAGGDFVYLFAREARLGPGHAQEELAWAAAITEKVNQISETKVSLWTTFMSPAVNTLYWTTFVEDLATIEAMNDKLMTD